MSNNLSVSSHFNVVDPECQNIESYKKYTPFFKFLEKLFWISDSLLTTLGERASSKPNMSPHQFVALSHLVWICGQIRGIVVLLNEALISQATQLIRSIWEVKVNLLYIAKKPEERCQLFAAKNLEEVEELRQEAEKGNPDAPAYLKNLPPIQVPNKGGWKNTVKVRANDVGLGPEYKTIYKKYSWPAHVSAAALRGYIRIDERNIDYDPNESPTLIPGRLMAASRISFDIIKELNRVLKVIDQNDLKKLKEELNGL